MHGGDVRISSAGSRWNRRYIVVGGQEATFKTE